MVGDRDAEPVAVDPQRERGVDRHVRIEDGLQGEERGVDPKRDPKGR